MSVEKETHHLVRERTFALKSTPVMEAVERLLLAIIGTESFTGNVTIHIFRGTATKIDAQDRAAVPVTNLTYLVR